MAKRFYSPFDRLAYTVDDDTGCWNWTKYVNPTNGYGYLTVDYVIRTAHTFSYEIHRGPIPDGLWIDHSCRNHRCINPDHMEPVSPGENARRGIRTKLCQSDVDTIRKLEGTVKAKEVAAMFGVSAHHVSQIWKGVRWGAYGARKKAEEASKARREARHRAAFLPDEEVAQAQNGRTETG